MSLQLLIFDVDGTLAETEEIQRKAFNRRQEDQLFTADEVLAKHDKNHMPPEVANALKKTHEASTGGTAVNTD